MKVYLATPITGVPDMNMRMVDAIAGQLRGQGMTVVIPHLIPPLEHDGPCPEADSYPGVTGGGTHGGLCYLKADIQAMLECDMVVVAPFWANSRGVRAELATAKAVAIPVMYYHPDEFEVRDYPFHSDRKMAFS